MKRSYLIGVLFFLSRIALASCSVTDDHGQHIVLAQPAKRIVSLAPDLTETLFAIGAGKQIVGVMQGSDYPDETKKIPIVAQYNSLNSEEIALLKPDLIVAWTEVPFVSQLKKTGVPVYLSEPKKIMDIPATMRRLACLTGHAQQGDQQALLFQHQYEKMRQQFQAKEMMSVFYQVWSKPLITVSQQSWINEIIILCGGKNIFANVYGAAPQVEIEAVLANNPQVILGNDVNNWSHWGSISAVKQHHYYAIHADWVERAGPRILNGIDEICNKINGVREDVVRK